MPQLNACLSAAEYSRGQPITTQYSPVQSSTVDILSIFVGRYFIGGILSIFWGRHLIVANLLIFGGICLLVPFHQYLGLFYQFLGHALLTTSSGGSSENP